VVDEMNREFQRLDQWLMEVGYKHNSGEHLRLAARRHAR
jgi:hypothetical protein